jgi:hypothetical protein
MYNFFMLKMSKIPLLILSLFLISGCSQSQAPSDQAGATKECAKIVPLFNEKLLSTEKSEKIQGWQYVLDYPACFTSGALDIAKTEIEALKNQK